MAAWHGMSRFTVELSDFRVKDLAVASDGKPRDSVLKVSFDENFKQVQSDVEKATRSPEYSIKESFNYRTRFIEKKKLSKKFLKAEILANDTGEPIGSSQVDLYTLVCGPNTYELTLMNRETPAGVLSFKCLMRMYSEVKITLSRLRCEANDCQEGCKLTVFPAAHDGTEVAVPFAKDSTWMDRSFSLVFESYLWELIDAQEEFCIGFNVLNEDGTPIGEARVPLRSHFSLRPEPIDFRASIRRSATDNLIGQLTGQWVIEQIPMYAQMHEGVGYDDDKISGGLLLYPGLPYPDYFESPPSHLPIGSRKESWHEGGRHTGVPVRAQQEAPVTHQPQQPQRVTYQVPLPPNWQRRFDRSTMLPYYADSRVKLTCWVDPRLLPPGWDQRIDPGTGKIYFADHKTRKTTFTDPRGCPPGWEMRLTMSDARPYFAFTPSRQTTYSDPRGCPPGVTPALDASGKMYFRHHSSRTTSWVDPRQGNRPEVLNMWRLQELQAWREAETVRLEEEANRSQPSDGM
eukprot:GHVN01084683.1.p1 GENE.GHVN01084683.1~~GHVN01084683.1.p1  ORF type:complete len:516 (-),score=61.47 GHVN01084683.1:90-1637(-)